jgi:hypothetical protein
MTAAAGFYLGYDPSIRHLTYDLQDRKTENISAHFDIAAFQIDKSTTALTQIYEMAAFWFIVGLESPA